MGHRPMKLLLGTLVSIAATMTASNATALGLGKIKLESSLNQPLDAEIELFEVRELTASEIRVSIASREDFERIGVDKTFFLSDLRFKVVLDQADNPVIEVSSRKLVREPFLNFVIQVQWPSGKLLREYTLLMDLPIYSGQNAPGVQQPSTAPSAATPSTSGTVTIPASPSSRNNERSSFEAAPARPSQREVKPTYTGDTYTVQSNDTLWEIAAQVRPNRSTSVHQTMIALQRNNPEAFINNNINLLKQGQVLRIPDSDEIAALSQRDAVQEVAVQNSAWSGDDSDVSDVQLSGSDSFDDDTDSVVEREGRVKLSSPDELYDSSEGRSSGSSDSVSTDALENELAITLEQLDKAGRENTELRSKVSSLEEQIETMERMIEVSNEKLRSLELAATKNAQELEEQEALADADDDISDDVASNLDDDSLEAGIDDISTDDGSGSNDELAGDSDEESSFDDTELDDGLDDGVEDTTATEEGVAEATPTPAVEPRKVVISRPVEEKGFLDILLDNLLYVIGAIVAIAAGAFFFLRKKPEDDTDDFLEPQEFVTNTQDDEPLVGDAFDGVENDLDEYNAEEEDPFAGYEEPEMGEEPAEAADAISEEDTEGEPETEDVVGEADIYIAYGKFDQAEEMLVKALKRSPNDEDARLKLLEVYANQGDAESFDPHYAKLRAFAPPTIVERAEALRDSIPNVAEFDEAGFDTSDVDQFSGGALDTGSIEQDDATVVAEPEDAGSFDFDIDGEPSAESDELSMELDLGNDSASLHEMPEASAEEGLAGFDNAPSDDSLDLDFDLDLPKEGSDESSFDLELDLPEEGADAQSIGDSLNDLESSLDDASAPVEPDFEIDADLDSDVSLDSLSETLDFSSPEEVASDVAESEPSAELDLSDELDGDLDLGGDIDLGGDVDLGGDLDLDSGLELDADIDLDGGLDIESDLEDEGALDLDVASSPDTNLTASGAVETSDFASAADELGDTDGDGSSIKEDSGLTLTDDLAALEEDEINLDAELDLEDLGDDLGGDLALDGDLNLDDDLSLDGEADTAGLADLEADLESLDVGDSAEASAEDGLDFDAGLDLDMGSEESGLDSAGDLDLPDLDAPDSGESLLSESLEADLASLDSDLDLSGSDDGLSDLDADLSLDEPAPIANDITNDFGGEDDTVLREPLTPPSDLSLDSADISEPSVSSDTVVNEALNDEYIEQKLSEDLTEDLTLPEEAGSDLGDDLENVEIEEDLDLSSLDDELDALTSNLSTEPLSPVGSDDSDAPAVMEEPVTDFDDFEDELEKDEAMAETVKSDHVSQADVDDMGEDTMFNEAIMEVPEADSATVEFELPEVDPEDAGDDDLEFLSDSDEIATKLDLARAYIDMGDQEGARDIIREVEGEGNDQQKAEAKTLLDRING